MSNDTTDANERTDLTARDVRALTEYMSVLPDGGDVFTVVSEGPTYAVAAREGRCTCPDHQYREERCKHLRRVAFATGDRPVPAHVDVAAVDPDLGEHVAAGPRVAATDGGEILEAGDDEEVLDDGTDERPADCECGEWNADGALPCWACFRDGFEAPVAPEGEL